MVEISFHGRHHFRDNEVNHPKLAALAPHLNRTIRSVDLVEVQCTEFPDPQPGPGHEENHEQIPVATSYLLAQPSGLALGSPQQRFGLGGTPSNGRQEGIQICIGERLLEFLRVLVLPRHLGQGGCLSGR